MPTAREIQLNPSKYATVFNPTTGDRRAVAIGDPNAFAGGYLLETPTQNLRTFSQNPTREILQSPTGPDLYARDNALGTTVKIPGESGISPLVHGGYQDTRRTLGLDGAPVQGTGVGMGTTPPVDPAAAFNSSIMEKLRNAQQPKQQPETLDADLLAQRNALINARFNAINEITPENLRMLTPGQQEALRTQDYRGLETQLGGVNTALQAREKARAEALAREKLAFEQSQAGMTADRKEYEFAKSQGYEGSWMDYQKEIANLKAPAASSGLDEKEILSMAVQLFNADRFTYPTLADAEAEVRGRAGSFMRQQAPSTPVESGKKMSQLSPEELSSVISAMAAREGFGAADPNNRPNRDNNPGNIKVPAGGIEVAKQRYGDQGITIDPVPATDGGYFLKFSSPEKGLQAIGTLLSSPSYANLSVDAALRRWSNNGYGAEIVSKKQVSQPTGAPAEAGYTRDSVKNALNSVSKFAKSPDSRKQLETEISLLTKEGRYDDAIQQMKTFVDANLTGKQREGLDVATTANQQFESALAYIGDNKNLAMGPYKVLWEKAKPYASINQDKEYATLKALIETGQAAVRNKIYGAALTDSERGISDSWLIGDKDTMPIITNKLKLLLASNDFVKDYYSNKLLGLKTKTLTDYFAERGIDINSVRGGKVTQQKVPSYSINIQGKTFSFPDQKSLDAFKKEAGL